VVKLKQRSRHTSQIFSVKLKLIYDVRATNCGEKGSVLVSNVGTCAIVFTTLYFLSCVCAGHCEGIETIACVMAWRQKRGLWRDSGRMKLVWQTVRWKSECKDKMTQRVIWEEGYNTMSMMRKEEQRRSGKELY
jgi:hypothetical protein